jgi:hypothetical protein
MSAPQWPERSPQLHAERLFPGGEMSAFVELVEVDEVAVGAPGPCLRRPIDVIGKYGDCDRKREVTRNCRRSQSTPADLFIEFMLNVLRRSTELSSSSIAAARQSLIGCSFEFRRFRRAIFRIVDVISSWTLVQ